MSAHTRSTIRRCDLCSLDTTDDVLCPSCREMISRLSSIAVRVAHPEIPLATTTPAIKRTAVGKDANRETRFADNNSDSEISNS